MSENLQEALVRELARMRDDVIPAYQSIGPAGSFALHMIRIDIKTAEDALAAGDVLRMMPALVSLQAVKL